MAKNEDEILMNSKNNNDDDNGELIEQILQNGQSRVTITENEEDDDDIVPDLPVYGNNQPPDGRLRKPLHSKTAPGDKPDFLLAPDFTARCTLVQSAVLRSHVVCPSVRLFVRMWRW